MQHGKQNKWKDIAFLKGNLRPKIFKSIQDALEEGISVDISEGSHQGSTLSGKAVF